MAKANQNGRQRVEPSETHSAQGVEQTAVVVIGGGKRVWPLATELKPRSDCCPSTPCVRNAGILASSRWARTCPRGRRAPRGEARWIGHGPLVQPPALSRPLGPAPRPGCLLPRKLRIRARGTNCSLPRTTPSRSPRRRRRSDAHGTPLLCTPVPAELALLRGRSTTLTPGGTQKKSHVARSKVSSTSMTRARTRHDRARRGPVRYSRARFKRAIHHGPILGHQPGATSKFRQLSRNPGT
jgi:hypothetical protein